MQTWPKRLLLSLVLFSGLCACQEPLPDQTEESGPARDLQVQSTGGEPSSFLMAVKLANVPKDQLDTQIHAIYDQRPAKLLFIKAGPNRIYQDVVEAMDVARGAGVTGCVDGPITWPSPPPSGPFGSAAMRASRARSLSSSTGFSFAGTAPLAR